MVTLNNKILTTLFFSLVLSLINLGSVDARVSQAATDTIKTHSGNNNIITVTQKGSGNSVSISQSGSNAKTNATVTSSGENNYTEITSGSDILQTEVTFLGNSNRLVTQPGPWIRLFSVQALPASFTKQDFNFAEFYFISKQHEKSLHIHQTSDGIRINKKKQ